MKKIFFPFLFLFALFSTLNGQIITRKAAEYQEPPLKPYDSISYYDFRQLVGQTLFVLPFDKQGMRSIGDTIYGYYGFFKRILLKRFEWEDIYDVDTINYYSKEESERMTDNHYNYFTSVNSLSEKSLKIIDIDIDKSVSTEPQYFKLVRLDNSDTIYYYFYYEGAGDDIRFSNAYEDSEFHHEFTIVGYYEKKKQQYLGKEFVVMGYHFETLDINTGKIVNVKIKSQWKCSGISPISKGEKPFPALSVILQNNDKEEISIPNSDQNNEFEWSKNFIPKDSVIKQEIDKQKKFLDYQRSQAKSSEEYRNQILRKFGSDYGQMVLENKVVLGMTKEMCQFSWGNPYTSEIVTQEGLKYEVWQYVSGSLLYFEDDKVKMIKEIKF